MQLRDLRTYLQLRRIARNPWDTLRFERNGVDGHVHVVQLAGGPYLYLRPNGRDFAAFEEIFLNDRYRLSKLPSGGFGVVVDLGGHVGLFAARASRLASRVITYEPSPPNFACLARNVAACLNVDAICAAIAGIPGTVRLYHPKFADDSHRYSCKPDSCLELSDRYDEVPAITLDNLFDQHQIDRCSLLKLSVAGEEYDILYSTPKQILNRIDRIHGEFHEQLGNIPGARMQALARFLARHGFEVEIEPRAPGQDAGLFFATRP